MTGETVYKAVLDYVRVDARGGVLTPDEFNRIAEIVNEKVLSFYVNDLELTQQNTDSLGFLKVFSYRVALTNGVGSLPSNYYQILGNPWYLDSGSVRRDVDVLATMEDSYREAPYSLSKATVNYPTCMIGGEDASRNLQIRVKPTTLSYVNINYLREVDTPFLDYCVNNTTKAITYFNEGDTVAVPSGSTYRDGTAGAVTKTKVAVDWEWSTDDLSLIIAYFLQIIGIAVPDNLLIEAGLKDKMEEE